MAKWVYSFGEGKAEGRGDQKALLGGKGSGLHDMTGAGVPVPPGFTITTEACNAFVREKKLSDEQRKQIDEALALLEKRMAKRLGDPGDPLLVSVRSGAKFSMPGMMDTILNLGLNDLSVEGLAATTRNERFAWDSYRRFISMFGNVVFGIDKDHFEEVLAAQKKKKRVKQDVELDAAALEEVAEKLKGVFHRHAGRDFPQEPKEQMLLAIEAVFHSWENPRAVSYRRMYDIPHDLGTACNVQAMVFGNKGKTSATGVGFTRDPSTGEKKFYGEYLTNAQGEDVVAGIRTPKPIDELESELPDAYRQLREITQRLENHYRDVQDFEFTIEEQKLYMLQTRTGKRTGPAAVRIACDMVDEKLITPEEAVMRVDPNSLDQLLHPVFDPAARRKIKPSARGLPASPGAASGELVFTADDAEAKARRGKRVVLIRKETVPDDIHGMKAAQGVLTATGGMTSHAAVVGRQMGKPSVVGCGALVIDEKSRTVKVGGKTYEEGDAVSLDGGTGEVFFAEIPTTPSEILRVVDGKLKEDNSLAYHRFKRLLDWSDGFRRLEVRANADIPKDAKTAFAFGAHGIGLCRTEHMFFAEERLPIVVEMILADTLEGRLAALKKLLPMQRADFYGLFKEMRGYAVTIRTLDPPLHEFLPKREDLMVEIAKLESKRGAPKAKLARLKKLLARVEDLHEFNPMLGFRGCRLGIVFPEITEMQVRAIFEAAARCVAEGRQVKPEVMIPLVGSEKELKAQKDIVVRVAEEVMAEKKVRVEYLAGTMIEVPRGALVANEIAREAQFFSFGTNDLTQMTFGFSRDDIGKFLFKYLEADLLPRDPFVSVDRDGVGELMRIAVQKGRATRPDLKIGICGEHGGDPSSVEFCHELGLNYVSCSPYRVPVARLAAAQAALKSKAQEGKKAA